MPTTSKKVVVFLFTASLVCVGHSPGAGQHRTGSADEEVRTGMQDWLKAPVVLAERSGAVESLAPILSATPSLTLDDQVHLGASSDFFKGGSLFLWDDASNTGLGRQALSANTTGIGNTASGANSLQANTMGSYNVANGTFALYRNTTAGYNTAIGSYAMVYSTTGERNTAVGAIALYYNTTGRGNTATGVAALAQNDTGYRNVATGNFTLDNSSTGNYNTATGWGAATDATGSYNTVSGARGLALTSTGGYNTAVGFKAGYMNTTGSSNVWIASYGGTESNTLRIGNGTGAGNQMQNRAFISGIRGVTTGLEDALPVLIDSADQLGTVSSSRRHKEDISDMASASERLYALRPVTFRYKREAAGGDKPIQFGLIAEEVAEVFPELVIHDDEGRPESVKYHLLSTLLLNEIQKLRRLNRALETRLVALPELERQATELARLRQEVAALREDTTGASGS